MFFIFIDFSRKVNKKMKEKGMNQRCMAHRVVVDGNWEDYMWPHQIDKTSRLDSEVLSFLEKLNLSELKGIFDNQKVFSMEVLLTLDKEDLEGIGIKLGDRKIILGETSKIRKERIDLFLLISSSGPAADHHSYTFGLYRKTEEICEGHSVYSQENDTKFGGRTYKLFSDKGVWCIAYNDTVRLRAATPSVSPASAKWRYYDWYENTWHDDLALTVTSLSEKPSDCEVTISLSEDVKRNMKEAGGEVEGLYKADGSYCKGWPVLRHEGGHFVLSVYDAGCWIVSAGVEGAGYLYSRSAPSQCPADPRAARNERLGQTHWKYWNKHGRDFESNGIIVKCNKH